MSIYKSKLNKNFDYGSSSRKITPEIENKRNNLTVYDEPFSVTFSDIYLTKTERKVVEPTKPQFYKIFVDILNKRYEEQPDNLIFQALNRNHAKTKYTTDNKLFGYKIIQNNGIFYY